MSEETDIDGMWFDFEALVAELLDAGESEAEITRRMRLVVDRRNVDPRDG